MARASIAAVGTIYDYFSAADASALALFEDGPSDDEFGLLGLKGADPTGLLGEVEDDPRFTRLLSDPYDEGRWLVALTDTLRDHPALATPTRLNETATAVLSDEDPPRGWTEDLLADFLQRLATLSRQAHDRRAHLYCLMSL